MEICVSYGAEEVIRVYSEGAVFSDANSLTRVPEAGCWFDLILDEGNPIPLELRTDHRRTL